ncbi:hydratase [Alsobacter metallidurans]|uniref:Hydratase n=1 Tax=Alsobacter metallidurans TaxID=340221 RepID=A0A917IB45_9HYPH|nr:fumarylacetoacetate hydrolase family protein [Alsobacter metallidurans]GGH30732.1 hydratase [Alsobacter metallidurans]
MTKDIADALLDSYRTKAPIASGSLPSINRQDAFATQAAVAQGLGVQVGGWKVAMPDATSTAAPMFSDVLLGNGARYALPPGGAVVEIELGVILTKDLPPRPGQPYTREEIGAAIGDALVGVEMVASRYLEMPPEAEPNRWLADNMGNGAYISGDAKPLAVIGDPATLVCRYWANGELQHEKTGGHPAGDPIGWLVNWANAQEDTLGGLKAGQLVTTGSISPPKRFTAPTRIEAELDRIGRVVVELV